MNIAPKLVVHSSHFFKNINRCGLILVLFFLYILLLWDLLTLVTSAETFLWITSITSVNFLIQTSFSDLLGAAGFPNLINPETWSVIWYQHAFCSPGFGAPQLSLTPTSSCLYALLPSLRDFVYYFHTCFFFPYHHHYRSSLPCVAHTLLSLSSSDSSPTPVLPDSCQVTVRVTYNDTPLSLSSVSSSSSKFQNPPFQS